MRLEIALIEPEIPQNTGNIARTCVALGCRLHLVGRLGFRVDERHVRRAGLDYWRDLDLTVWPEVASFQLWLEQQADTGRAVFYATTKGRRAYSDVVLTDDPLICFGKETAGLPPDWLQAHPERCLRIPMQPGQRSLNLSNSVAVIAYEAMRQSGFPGLVPGGAEAGIKVLEEQR